MIVRKQGDWLAARIGDELVMMNAEKGNYLGLTEVGVRIWDLIATPTTVADVCARLMEEFDVSPDVCRTEVDAFLQDLAERGVIALVSSPAS